MLSRIFISQLIDPFTNLAIENELLSLIKEPSLFLYQNAPAVVIGRAQNPWLEADVTFLQQNNIPLVRRQSGGGTVVHDLGNLNFSFLSPREQYHKETHLKIIQTALAKLDRQIEIGEKCDLLFQGKKISGSAFRETKNSCFHHGTLLLNSDLHFLRRCLQAPRRNIVSKSVRSRPASVTNLNLETDSVKEILIQTFLETYAIIPTQTRTQIINNLYLSLHFREDNTTLKDTITLYQSDDWVYGKTLPFTEEIVMNGKRVTLMHDPAISARMTLTSVNHYDNV